MTETASELSRRLADRAEAVCRRYLFNGRREGRYWTVGDIRNAPGRSLYVRLHGTSDGERAAGKWTDAATGDHGDLLDLIRESQGLTDFHDVADEARAFLGTERPAPAKRADRAFDGRASAQRLFAMSRPIAGTLAEAYLRGRGITAAPGPVSLRFHARCYYKPDDEAPMETWPAMIAAVTDGAGRITGAHRTWLDPETLAKAPLATPRRAMGGLNGNAVRFGVAGEVMAAGEGLETMLSLRSTLPDLPVAAALSAAHLAAMQLSDDLRRLYIARDNDPAGKRAATLLAERAEADGIEAVVLTPRHGDFNDDLRAFGVETLRAALRTQVATQDVARFFDGD
jgi:hypothetical protein